MGLYRKQNLLKLKKKKKAKLKAQQAGAERKTSLKIYLDTQ